MILMETTFITELVSIRKYSIFTIKMAAFSKLYIGEGKLTVELFMKYVRCREILS